MTSSGWVQFHQLIYGDVLSLDRGVALSAFL